MVYTPVGPRCPECAAVRRLPTYDVSPVFYARALGAGVGLALISGFVWGLIGGYVFLFSILIALGVGYAVGEGISLSVRRKRGLGLQVIAGISVLLAATVRGLVPILLAMPQALLDTSWALTMVGQAFLRAVDNPWSLIFIGAAIFMAVRRL